jgi:DNA-binding LytR/AlgR family response regulator
LPRTARTIQLEFQRQGNKSVLSVPVFHDKKLYGIIGFDTTAKHRTWSAAEVGALFQCANLIGQAKYANARESGRAALYESATSVVYLRMRGVVRGVQPDAIVGVRSAGNYSEIWLEDGSMVLDSRALGMWSSLLPENLFFRVHRTAIANALHVMDVDRRSVDKWLIRMRAVGSTWPVSRSYRKLLRERMGL